MDLRFMQKGLERGRVAQGLVGRSHSSDCKERERVEEYRNNTITQSAYRIYTTILASWLKGEIEKKGVLPPNQTGFRKRVEMINNVYVLNYLINRL